MTDTKKMIAIDSLPTAIKVAAEMGLSGSNEAEILCSAWNKLSPDDRTFAAGVIKGTIVALSHNSGKEVTQ